MLNTEAKLYSDSLKVFEARELYFQKSGFDESSYTKKWVKLPVLSFNIYLPNVSPRRKAVPLHDIDHVLTEYPTDWLGEWQISSYELGTGCGFYWIGWLINLQAILIGAIRAPSLCVRAYARGRKSKGVYRFATHEALLDKNLGDLRELTTFEGEVDASFTDVLLFYSLFAFSVFLHLAPMVLVGGLLFQFL